MIERGGVVPNALAGERLDRVVALMADVSRSEAAGLVDGGHVSVGGEVVSSRSRRVAVGEDVRIQLAERATGSLVADPSVPFVVLHEDPDLVVVDKPAGVVVHPGAGNPQATLVNGLLARYPDMRSVGEPDRPGIVHRLDAGTSGVLAVARSPRAYRALVGQLADRTASRRYQALVWGHLADVAGVIDAPIGRSRRDPTRMAAAAHGRPARTRYRVVQSFHEPAPLSLLACELESGRTHQIRVHLAAIGHPVVGDPRYGGVRPPMSVDRPLLHAEELVLVHPVSGEQMRFHAPLPPDFTAILESLA